MKRFFTTILMLSIGFIVNAQWVSNNPSFNSSGHSFGFSTG